jgi:hypothetical protein
MTVNVPIWVNDDTIGQLVITRDPPIPGYTGPWHIGPIYLRDHVCYVDGHEGSDLDPGVICLHCGLYQGDECHCGSPNCWLCDDDDEPSADGDDEPSADGD